MIRLKSSHFIPLIIILIFYFIVRLQNLTSLPVFGDEAIYIRWSQIIKNVETLRFIPLTDGKQPLFMWFTAVLLKIISDPLVAGRIVSIFAGSLTLATIYIFSLLFFNFPMAIISAMVYLLLPFTFFFDRLAVPDNLLSTFGTISLLISFLLAKYPRLDLALITGFSLGLAWLTKSPAIYFIVLLFVTFVLYRLSNYQKIYFPLISAFVAFLIYSILRLGPQFHQIALRNLDYVWPLSEILKHPFDPLIPHLNDILSIYQHYISLPVISLVILGFYLFRRRLLSNQVLNILFLWWFLPSLATLAFAKVFTARYILFTLPALIILASFGIFQLFTYLKFLPKNIYFQILLIILSSLINIIFIYKLSTAPYLLKLPSTESGYIKDWTSGWGIKQVAEYLITRSKEANVIVGTEGYFGTLPDGLQIYTDSRQHLTVFGVGIDLNKIPDKLIDARNYGDEVYLLMNRSRLKLPPNDFDKLTLIQTHIKPDSDQLQLFQLK